jgi:hypothetical protein
MQIVTAAETAALCKDFTGDGNPDNGLGNLASYTNAALHDSIEDGETIHLLEFQGVSDFTNTASFTLNGLQGESTNFPFVYNGNFYVKKESYALNGSTLISFKNATISSSKLMAGPETFYIKNGLFATVLDLKINEAEIIGMLANGGADGVEVLNFGTITGKAYKNDIMSDVDELDTYCKSCGPSNPDCPTVPDKCAYVPNLKNLLPSLMDLDNKTAMSVCYKFSGIKANILGYAP